MKRVQQTKSIELVVNEKSDFYVETSYIVFFDIVPNFSIKMASV